MCFWFGYRLGVQHGSRPPEERPLARFDQDNLAFNLTAMIVGLLIPVVGVVLALILRHQSQP